MSILGRMMDILQGKTQQFLDKIEDPNASLDLSYEKMLSGLQETKRHLADVVTEQKTLERQIASVQAEVAKAEDDARVALQAGREDLARTALGQKHDAQQRQLPLQQAYEAISAQAQKLIAYEQALVARIEHFRTEKEVMKSSYAAAQAQVKVTEALTGVGHDLQQVGDTVRRASDKVAAMQSRAEAMDSLLQAGVLEDPLAKTNALEKELQSLKQGQGVDADLERLKAELQANKA